MRKLTVWSNQDKRLIDGRDSYEDLQKKFLELKKLTNGSITMQKIVNIKTHQSFEKIFPINPLVLDSLIENIQERGFDFHHPILLWSKHNYVIDGHTRLKAAQNVGLSEVPVIMLDFDSEDEILETIYSIQFDRRNLSHTEKIYFLIQYLENTKEKITNLRAKIAKLIGVSERTAQKYLTLIEHQDSLFFIDFVAEKISLNQAYQRINLEKAKASHTPKHREINMNFGTEDIETVFRRVKELPENQKSIVFNFLKDYTQMLYISKVIQKEYYGIIQEQFTNFEKH